MIRIDNRCLHSVRDDEKDIRWDHWYIFVDEMLRSEAFRLLCRDEQPDAADDRKDEKPADEEAGHRSPGGDGNFER